MSASAVRDEEAAPPLRLLDQPQPRDLPQGEPSAPAARTDSPLRGLRKISPLQGLAAFGMMGLGWAGALATALAGAALLPLGPYQGVAVAVATLLLGFLYAAAIYRLFLAIFPLPAGPIPHGSRAEAIYHIHALCFMLVFYSLMRTRLLPIPLSPLWYRMLGARMGSNSFAGGVIYDPCFVSIGHNCLVGDDAKLVPHVIENGVVAHYPIRVGHCVTIGTSSVVLGGVEIGDGALVAAGAVVAKGTRIGPREIWGGIPARRLR